VVRDDVGFSFRSACRILFNAARGGYAVSVEAKEGLRSIINQRVKSSVMRATNSSVGGSALKACNYLRNV
jgi:hypothetical protein